MKRIIFYICIVLLGLFLISCKHESSDISEESAKVATVQFSLNTNTRTVLPQIVDTSDLTDFNLQVKGTNTSWTRSYTYSTLNAFLSANITLDAGTWTFTLTAKKGGTSYSASTTTEIVYGDNLINFNLSIADMGNGTGAFSLTLDFSEANNADKVTSAKCSIQTMYGSAVSGFSQTSVSVQNESVTYSLNSLPVGNYRVFITLYSNDLELITWREIVVISSDLQSTATQKLKSLNLYHISYVLNDDEENPASFTETTTETYTRNTDSFDLAMLSRNAYSFEGWYDDREFSGEPITILDTSRAEDVTLYAKWIPKDYSITYNLNGGTFDTEYPENFDISEKVTLVNPIRTGYTFDGWHLNEDFSDDSVSEIPLGSSEDKVLYARWNLIEYTITYNLNGGQFDSEYPAIYTIESETFEIGKPVKEHYFFCGWFEDDSFSGNSITKIMKGASKNFVLYAKWESAISDSEILNLVFSGNGVTLYNNKNDRKAVEIDLNTYEYYVEYKTLSVIVKAKNPYSSIFINNSQRTELDLLANDSSENDIEILVMSEDGLSTTSYLIHTVRFFSYNEACDIISNRENDLRIKIIDDSNNIDFQTRNGKSSIGSFINMKTDSNVVLDFSSTSITRILCDAFKDCENLKEILLPASVTQIYSNAFTNCRGLTTFNWNSSISGVGNGVFSGCTGIKEIIIPKGVSRINDYLFSGCTNLEKIRIPDSVNYIGLDAFYGCDSLLLFSDITSEWYGSVVENCAIKYPIGKMSASGENLGKFKDYKYFCK